MTERFPRATVEPHTRVEKGHETEALTAHIRKLSVWIAYRRAIALLLSFENEEQSRQKLLKAAFMISFTLLAALAVYAFALLFL